MMPELRTGQFISNALDKHKRDGQYIGDLFYISDNELATALERYTPRLRWVIVVPATDLAWLDRRHPAWMALGKRLARRGVTTVVMPWTHVARSGLDWTPGGGVADLVVRSGEEAAAEAVGTAVASFTSEARRAA
jgi:hypothetical protein